MTAQFDYLVRLQSILNGEVPISYKPSKYLNSQKINQDHTANLRPLGYYIYCAPSTKGLYKTVTKDDCGRIVKKTIPSDPDTANRISIHFGTYEGTNNYTYYNPSSSSYGTGSFSLACVDSNGNSITLSHWTSSFQATEQLTGFYTLVHAGGKENNRPLIVPVKCGTHGFTFDDAQLYHDASTCRTYILDNPLF